MSEYGRKQSVPQNSPQGVFTARRRAASPVSGLQVDILLLSVILIWSFALQHIGVSRTVVYSNLTPLVAMLGGWLILGERPALAQFAGVVLILGGVYIVRSKKSAYSPMDARLQMVEAIRQQAK